MTQVGEDRAMIGTTDKGEKKFERVNGPQSEIEASDHNGSFQDAGRNIINQESNE